MIVRPRLPHNLFYSRLEKLVWFSLSRDRRPFLIVEKAHIQLCFRSNHQSCATGRQLRDERANSSKAQDGENAEKRLHGYHTFDDLVKPTC